MSTKTVLRQWGRGFGRWLFRLTSVRAGLATILVALGVFLSMPRAVRQFVTSVDHHLFDAMFRVRGPQPTSGQVVIVDIDERSLEELGQWPWPRTTLARILENIKAGGAKVVGMDIVFAEPDRSSPRNYAKYYEELAGRRFELAEGALDNDVAFGEALGEMPAVGGYVFLMRDESDGRYNPDVRPVPGFTQPLPSSGRKDAAGKDPELPLWLAAFSRAYRPILSIPAISDNVVSEGFFNMFPDPATGIVRKVPLLIAFGDEDSGYLLYPSLPMEMLREGLKVMPQVQFASVKRPGVVAVKLGDHTLPTDSDAQMTVNFRGGKRTFRYESAWRVYQGKTPEEVLRDKFVLIGTSAAGLLDLRATPFDSVCPGVEVHANMIDNALIGDPMVYDPLVQVIAAVLITAVAGVLLTVILAYAGPVWGGLTGAALMAGLLLGNYFIFFLRNQLMGLAFPLAALVAVFVVVTLVNYFHEGRAKRVVRGMFQTMVSGDVLKYMEAHPGSFSLQGEARQATMFFSDVAGFTTISESLTPEKLVQLLNAYLTPMTEIVMNSQGYVDKYEGDAIMAEWGVPFPSDKHAQLACHAALDQQVKLAEIREDLFQRFGHRLFVRMGLNSGTVSAGNMGSTRRFSYTVMGDAVNQAARFEPANKDYGTDIMIGNLTYELARDHIESRLLDKLVVKGKTEPILIHELIGKKGQITADKAEIVALYVEALKVHWARDFDGALERLRKVLHIDPADGPAKAFIARIEEYKVTPPPAAWKGEFVRTKKD